MRKTTWNAKMLATAAACIALSMLLSYLKIFEMPQGGSVTALSMLPVMLFGWLYGVGPGLVAGTAYGLLQFIQKPEIFHWAQIILDYPLAFAMLGLAGAFRKRDKPWALPAGIVIASLGRFLCHLVSGIAFFAEYAPAADFVSVLLYSAGYNGGFMAVECVLTAVVAALPPVRAAVRRVARL